MAFLENRGKGGERWEEVREVRVSGCILIKGKLCGHGV